MTDPSWPRPLVGAALLAAAFVAVALARSPEPGVEVREVRLTSPKGERVPALLIRPSGETPRRGKALLAHGITASKETLRPIAEALARAGFVCCAIDLPSHGASTTPPSAALRSEVQGASSATWGALQTGAANHEPW